MITDPKIFHKALSEVTDVLSFDAVHDSVVDDWNGVPCLAYRFFLENDSIPGGTLAQIVTLMNLTEYACLTSNLEGELYIKVNFQRPQNL